MKKLVLFIAALALISLPQVARGQLSDSMSVYSLPNGGGMLLDYLAISEQDEINNPNKLWTMPSAYGNSAIWNTLAGAPTLVFEGSAEGDQGTVSDVYGIARVSNGVGGWNYFLAFLSDPDPNVWTIAALENTFGYSYSSYPQVTENLINGGVFDATPYVDWSIENNDVVGSASFYSDVPEPATITLLLLSFGASALRMLRKNRTA